mmetsp:Transcript_72456/g.235364  ORF Transcript_72456/g.235364 Transcript_72456/m.235364 type:complete len:275 (-) Transcript_72456:25-849(-)
MLGIVCPRIGDVLEDVLLVQAVALGDLHQPLRAEGPLCVDVQRLALAPTAVDGQLARHAERVAELGLPTPELAEDLRDLPGLDPTLQQAIQLGGARGDLHHVLAHHQHLRSADHAHGDQLLGRRHDPLRLLVPDALDLKQLAHRHKGQGLHAVDASLQERIEVTLGQIGAPVLGRGAEHLQPRNAGLVRCPFLRLNELLLSGCLYNGLRRSRPRSLTLGRPPAAGAAAAASGAVLSIRVGPPQPLALTGLLIHRCQTLGGRQTGRREGPGHAEP